MDHEMTTSKWITFFMDAGIPASMAANYAVLFFDNRIQRDMLLDLTKDVLNEMGIRAVGDVIAILKHAKVAYAQVVTDRVSGTKLSKPPTIAVPKVSVTPVPASKPAPIVEGPRLPPVTLVQPVKTTGMKRARTVQPPATKKPRRVDPEEEGAYSIKMPTGNTPRSMRILLQKNAVVTTKKSVFDRLGEGIVSSTTDTTTTVIKNHHQQQLGSGVFARLGNHTAEPAATPVLIRRVIDKPLSQLVPAATRKTTLGVRRTSDNTTTSLLAKTLSEISRQQGSASLSRRVLSRQQMGSAARKPNIKQRLGARPSQNKSATVPAIKRTTTPAVKSVFSRLGVTSARNTR